MSCLSRLDSHATLSRRKTHSSDELVRVREMFGASGVLKAQPITVFCAGSLARGEVGRKSDLDLFVTGDEGGQLRSRLCEYSLIAELIHLNRALSFPEFSNDGEYLKVCFIDDLKRKTGSPRDDSENLFTTRMLMLLESEPIVGSDIYERHLRAVLEHYYRDNVGKASFRPLFLLNDILRYWRTLCLNYEERRHDPAKPWRKKNVNLKFARMVTVFSSILPLILEPIETSERMFEVCRRRPLDRLAASIDQIGDPALVDAWPSFLDAYEEFLGWKEDADESHQLETGELRDKVRERAELVSNYLHSALTSDSIRAEFRRYLIL